METVWNQVVQKTREFVEGAGFSKVVVGLSGGIDSSMVACIAVRAFGRENVLGVMMPSPYSSAGSINDSAALAKNWGFEAVEIPIAPLMASFDSSLEPYFAGTESGLAEENIQARIRAVLLMALSNKQGRMLLNTCNKSEDYVGYCTLYGDSCGAVAPIGGLYKTEVYALARWINGNPDLSNIPEAILTKEPSAELREGQKDTDSLPPYEILDAVLKALIEGGKTLEEITALGFEPDMAAQVVNLMNASEFKRRQSPPVILVERKGS